MGPAQYLFMRTGVWNVSDDCVRGFQTFSLEFMGNQCLMPAQTHYKLCSAYTQLELLLPLSMLTQSML